MNNQEAFNIMYAHALSMPRQSGKNTGGGSCLYRSVFYGEPNCCLVGKLIPDELYKPEMEERMVKNLISEFIDIQVLFEGVDEVLLWKCQCAHDSFAELTTHSWRIHMLDQLRAIASEYGLTVPQE